MQIDRERALPIVRAAIKEDIGSGDITTTSLVCKSLRSSAVIVSREDCVVCGVSIAEMVMSQIDAEVSVRPACKDGSSIGRGMEILFLEGSTASILRAERTMVNFLTFLSGISTRTMRYVEKARPYGVKIMDTRKTIPLLRYLEKYAVRTGGGTNHRMGLYDQVLIKDNHICCRRASAPAGKTFSLKDIVEESRRKNRKGVPIEIEVESVKEFGDAILGRPDTIMLDNMTPEEIRSCVEIRKLSRSKPLLEVSGGITLDTVEEFAGTGVDMISVGELTDSVTAIDMSLEMA